MMFRRLEILLCLLLCGKFAALARGAEARAWEGTIELPTYVLGQEDPNPPFPLAHGHRIYPYTMLDDLTDHQEVKTYRAIFLENEYLKAIILPDLGGRLYSLYDKINNREVFYRNKVVKYGLVALRGAWISGGVEFNIPDGHTAITVSPVSSTFRQDPDGSATAMVGDVDRVTGMHWEVALKLRPGLARLEQQVTLFNCTPRANLYWYWANAAVPATDDMQFIYPMREAIPHMRGVVWSYPFHNGVDYSWYKNVREPTSLFGRQVHRNFFGAYYHQSDFGVVHVADFRQVPGKKVWTWGVAGDGLIWTGLLTDHDGPYNEIQSGRYQTQLNYEFIPPRRVEKWTEYWYPVSGLGGGFVEATPEIAVNVRYLPAMGNEKAQAEVRVSPTVEISGARVTVKLGPYVLKEFAATALAPLRPTEFGVKVDDLESARKNLVVDIAAADKTPLLEWSAAEPIDGNPDFIPASDAPAPKPLAPESMSVEQLYLSGVEQEKDGDEAAALNTYRAVLQRDPGYVHALVKLAWGQYRAANFRSSEQFMARALARNGTDPEVHYAAGVVYRASQRFTLAQDAFWAAIHFGGPPAPAFAQLGEISIRLKKYGEAARLLRRALSYNPDDAVALSDLSVALRLSEKLKEASTTIDEALERMPLLPQARAEKWELAQTGSPSAASPLASAPFGGGDVENYLEAAAWYFRLDDFQSASTLLTSAKDTLAPSAISPLVYYYLAALEQRQGHAERASQSLQLAGKAPYAKVFPNRLADAQVLDEALQSSPLDSHAQYLLGNFLFAHGRYDAAARLWSQALGEGFEYSVLMRNLGLHAWQVKKDLASAAGFYESAIRLAPGDYRLYVDLDDLYFRLNKTEAREKLFAQAPGAVLERDTVRVRRALLETQKRHYEQALELLTRHRFKPWEGGRMVREMYVLANVQMGRQALEAKKFSEAEKAFRRALEYPVGLGVGRPDKPHDEEALYGLGESLAREGKSEAAREAWRQAAEQGKTGARTANLFRGLALRRLGESQEADKILKALAAAIFQKKPSAEDFYAAGLLDLLQERSARAKSAFTRALEIDPSLWQARLGLEQAGS
jgi:tetratricopeptide (TPR) repeat protein